MGDVPEYTPLFGQFQSNPVQLNPIFPMKCHTKRRKIVNASIVDLARFMHVPLSALFEGLWPVLMFRINRANSAAANRPEMAPHQVVIQWHFP